MLFRSFVHVQQNQLQITVMRDKSADVTYSAEELIQLIVVVVSGMQLTIA